MNTMDWIFLGLIVMLLGLMVVLLIITVNDISNNAIYKRMKKRFGAAVKNALVSYYDTKDYEQCVFELNLAFKEIVLKNEFLKREYANIAIILEKHVIDINSEELVLENIDTVSYKKAVHDLLIEYNTKNPLEQIKGSDYIVLKQILDCIDTRYTDKGIEIVNQLALQLKSLQDSNREKEGNSKKQDAIAKVGIVLSVVFGIMTFVQFFI